MRERACRCGVLALALALAPLPAQGVPPEPAEDATEDVRVFDRAVRGITIGPIESALHPHKGYGSAAFESTLREVRRMGGTWVSLTPFGRVASLNSTGIAYTFEQPFAQNRRDVLDAIRQAHALGLRVLLVPHLWVESGGWRGELEPGDEAAWEIWSESYAGFLRVWAEVARDARADMLAVGVELRSWVTTARAPSFAPIIAAVRGIYPGPLTYAANWDDATDTVIWGDLDIIGINGFFPLAQEEDAAPAALAAGGRAVAERVRKLSELWQKPVMFTEFGYTTRKSPAVRPWEWPDGMKNVVVDQVAQAEAYEALLAPLLDEPRFIGAFAWRFYADPDDLSQEAEWGFSPRGKLAELVLRDAFLAHWAADGARPVGASFSREAAERVGVF